METLKDFRIEVSETARGALSVIWQWRRERREWIPTRVLHHRCGKERATSMFDRLGGSVVRRVPEGSMERYQLTFLGVLLTDQGEMAEFLLSRYLEYLRDRFATDPELNTVLSREVEAALGLNKDESELLSQVIDLGHLWGGSAGFGGAEWNAGVPNNIDDFVGISDFHNYITKHAMQDYDPALPVGEGDRARYAFSKNPHVTDELWFVKDLALRQQLLDDWHEAQSVFQARAWKSCLVLCGGILEGVLLDSLSRDKQTALQTYLDLRGIAARDLNTWTLVDLVEVADRAGILQKGTAHLGHALREYRNLIHPARQLRLKVAITEDEATIAMSTVRATLRLLAATAGGK